jgi:uncharacterized oxidoreductase
MQMNGNTILITGGTSGIGFELAKQLLALDNTVIVTGRDQSKLDETKNKLARVHTIQSDVSDPAAITLLFDQVTKEFPDLNIIVNNAGIMRKINLHDKGNDLVDIAREIEINLTGPVRMVKKFLAFLKTKKTAAIVNASSGLAFVPLPISPVYSATKAGIHSFTQSLRIQLKDTNIQVFELAPPGTETPLFSGEFTADDLGGAKGMKVQVLAKRAIDGLRKNTLEIRPGLSNVLKLMSRVAPQFILKLLGKPTDKMLALARN